MREGEGCGGLYRTRHVLILLASIQSFCISGLVYGWPSLVLILKDEGVFEDLCSSSDANDGSPSSGCSAQDIRFSSIFTVGTCALLSSLFFMGLFLDRFGPRASCMAGCAFVALGGIFFGLSYLVQVDFYLIGFALVGFGGPAVHTSFIHLSNLYPTQKPLIISLFNGVFSLSGYVFLIFRIIYVVSDGYFDIPALFWTHALLVLGFFLLSLTWPKDAYKLDTMQWLLGEEAPSQYVGEASSPTAKAIESSELESERPCKAETDFPAAEGLIEDPQLENSHSDTLDPRGIHAREAQQGKYSALSFGQQLLTREYLANVVFMCVNVLGLQFYIGTASEQLLRMGDVDSTYTLLANLITPLGALGIPLYGWALNTSFAGSYLAINTLGMLMNLTAMVNVLPLQILTFSLWAVYRTWIFSAAYAYVAFFFGFKNFGKVNGLTLATAGAVSLSQLLLSIVSASFFGGEFFWLNAMFVGARVPLLGIVWWLWKQQV